MAIQVYVKRGLQARVKSGTDAFVAASADKTLSVDGVTDSVTLSGISQYEPYYAESSYSRYQENIKQEHVGDGHIKIEKLADITASAAGGYDDLIFFGPDDGQIVGCFHQIGNFLTHGQNTVRYGQQHGQQCLTDF